MSGTTVEHRDGVQLEKHIEEEEFNFPSVVYEFRSEWTEPATVEVSESVSEQLERNQVGIHAEYEPEQYEVVGDELVFDIDLEPDSERTVAYALRPSAPVEIEELADAPTEFSVTPIDEIPQQDEDADTTPHAEASRNDQNPQESPMTGSPTEKAADPLPQDADAETSPDPVNVEGPTQSTETPPEPDRTSEQSGEDSLVDQFVAELKSGRGSEESLAYLDRQFGSTQHSGSMDARIKQLQRDFADIRAYTSALEEFLDENGSGREMIDSFEERLDAVENDTASLETTVSHQETEVADLRDDLQAVQSEVTSVSAEVTSLTEDVKELSEEIAELDEQLPDENIDDRFAELEDDVAQLTEFTSKLRDAFQDSFTT